MEYTYHTARGIAVLNKGDDYPLKKIGTFKSEADAIKACKEHYKKACTALERLGKETPKLSFI